VGFSRSAQAAAPTGSVALCASRVRDRGGGQVQVSPHGARTIPTEFRNRVAWRLATAASATQRSAIEQSYSRLTLILSPPPYFIKIVRMVMS
jgi:hypothetical protein